MVKLSDKVSETFPDLNFFVIQAEKWNELFGHPLYLSLHIMTRFFCTLEGSISIRSVNRFIKKGLLSIDLWDPMMHNNLEWAMNGAGIAFAETGKIYGRDDLEELKMDYLIAKITGLK